MFSFRVSSRITIIILFALLTACGGKNAQNPGTGQEDPLPAGNSPAQPSVLKSDPEKELALQEAALSGDGAIVDKLIEDGINVNASDTENRTALMYAAFNGHTEIVRSLLKAGAEVSLRDVAGRTALLYASTGPFPETVKLLLDHNADPNIKDAAESFTPVMHAAAEGQVEVVRILLEYGADPTMRDIDGETAYQFAVTNGHTEVAELLKR